MIFGVSDVFAIAKTKNFPWSAELEEDQIKDQTTSSKWYIVILLAPKSLLQTISVTLRSLKSKRTLYIHWFCFIWHPGFSRKGLIKIACFSHPSVSPSVYVSGCFLRCFLNFKMVLETHRKLCMVEICSQ